MAWEGTGRHWGVLGSTGKAVGYTGMGLWAILGITVGPWIILEALGRALGCTGTH